MIVYPSVITILKGGGYYDIHVDSARLFTLRKCIN